VTILENNIVKNVKDISKEEEQRIIDFLQGAIYCWCKNRSKEWFSLRDLMGKENFHWQGTPLFVLYQKHEDKGKESNKAIEEAGKDAGWLLKKVLQNDIRKFETKEESFTRKYKWHQ